MAHLHNTARLTAGLLIPCSVRRAPCLWNYFFLSPNLTNLSLFLAQVEMMGFEPLASAVQGRRSPN